MQREIFLTFLIFDYLHICSFDRCQFLFDLSICLLYIDIFPFLHVIFKLHARNYQKLSLQGVISKPDMNRVGYTYVYDIPSSSG